ncbi:MAG: 23S rRNA (adenine(2503)-C(2))-methyltransferase RlmN [Deltaproteobacteria bacterium]|nr:23S rRNA (adenine(2503)-C(2))-methyltransferase RlmN [Deltaproteobacteria bacterium]
MSRQKQGGKPAETKDGGTLAAAHTTASGQRQTDILSAGSPGLSAWLKEHGEEPFRAGQILRWVCQRQADSFEEMTDIKKDLRERLARDFVVPRLALLDQAESGDGSVKYLFGLSDGQAVEAVLMAERDHYTLCVSSQVGCAMGCAFCRTGAMGLSRNLTAGEIVAQVRDALTLAPGKMRLTNLVFMGMGEPLANYDNLVAAITLLMDADRGFAFAGRKVTVSTAGIAPNIPRLGRDTRASLAVSLNAVDDALRTRLMPINATYPIEDLLAACNRFPLQKGRRITFEYVLLAGVNDSVTEAKKLASLLHPKRAKVNLIPYNPHDASPFSRPSERAVRDFQQVLLDRHYTTVIRKSRGADIHAACGQLRAKALGE